MVYTMVSKAIEVRLMQVQPLPSVPCRDGEIGRHGGLKSLWGKTRTGSSPVLGTIVGRTNGKSSAS